VPRLFSKGGSQATSPGRLLIRFIEDTEQKAQNLRKARLRDVFLRNGV